VRFIVLVSLLFLFQACETTLEDLSLKQSIQQMITSIESGNIMEFFDTWYDPVMYEKLKQSDDFERIQKEGLGERQEKVLAAFREVTEKLPEEDTSLDRKDGIVAFKVDGKDLEFKEIDGRWRFISR